MHKIADTENSSKVKFAFVLNCMKKKKKTYTYNLYLHYKLKTEILLLGKRRRS